MPQSKGDLVVKAYKSLIEGLNLLTREEVPAKVVDRDRPLFNPARDTVPLIEVSPAKIQESNEIYSASRIGIVYPVQITLVGASDSSQTEGRGLLDEWKESIRRSLEEKQPMLISNYLSSLDNSYVYNSWVVGGEPLDQTAWGLNYDVHVLFGLVEIVETYSDSN